MDSMTENDLRIEQFYRQMIDGHVFIRESIDALMNRLQRHLEQLGSRPRILELGSHIGIITERILALDPHAEIVVADESEDLVALARRRLEGKSVEYVRRVEDTLEKPVDFVVSVARHHHLPHDYLPGVRKVMKPSGVYIFADELCPEYCEGEHAARIQKAEMLHIVGGYVLTSKADVAAFEQDRRIPDYAHNLERLRQRALWRWYRFVVDTAVENGHLDVAVGELQSAHDDLITGSDAEHKFSPLVVERQFNLAGFRQVSKRLVGPADAPERQSMFVYAYALA
jgi:SAM-dependent methyltransferase